MAFSIQFVEKVDRTTFKKKKDGSDTDVPDPRRVDNLSSLCCWCYKITKTSEDRWLGIPGINVPKTIDVKDPAELKDCTECNKYERVEDPADKKRWIIVPNPRREPAHNENELTICFVAPCTEDTKGAEFSREEFPS